MKVWINGKFLDINKARISVFDRGFLYGDGIFETMRSYAGAAFRLDDHLDRFFRSLKAVRMRPSYSKRCLKEAVYDILKINGLKSAYIRLTMTRGEGRFGLFYKDIFTPNAVIVAKEFIGYPGAMYDRGISAKVVAIRRNDRSALCGIKSLNFLPHILARFEARESGHDEAILLNTRDFVAEGSTSNIFLINRERLITPSIESGILPGVTRRVVIEIAGRLGLGVRERTVSYRELVSANEVFFTNSLVEVLPVVKIDSKEIGDGSPGELTRLLGISYQKQVILETLR